MFGRVTSLSCAIAVAATLGTPVLAATSGSRGHARAGEREARPLTLEEAIQLALERNEVPAIARARLQRASAVTRAAWARLLPIVALDGSYIRRQRGVEREVGGTTAVIQSQNALGLVGVAEVSVLDAPAIPLVMSA